MRKRFQKGSLRKVHGAWIGRWYEDGQPRSKKLGNVSEMTKSEAWGSARRDTATHQCQGRVGNPG